MDQRKSHRGGRHCEVQRQAPYRTQNYFLPFLAGAAAGTGAAPSAGTTSGSSGDQRKGFLLWRRTTAFAVGQLQGLRPARTWKSGALRSTLMNSGRFAGSQIACSSCIRVTVQFSTASRQRIPAVPSSAGARFMQLGVAVPRAGSRCVAPASCRGGTARRAARPWSPPLISMSRMLEWKASLLRTAMPQGVVIDFDQLGFTSTVNDTGVLPDRRRRQLAPGTYLGALR